MDANAPLSRLLSQVLIAFTIEFDNEWERRIADSGLRRLYPVSLVMWSNYMRFVREEGVSVRELQALAAVSKSTIASRVGALKRWGYVTVAPDPSGGAAGGAPARREWVVRPTRAGRNAQNVWRPLGIEIEQRWAERFGADEIDELRRCLAAVVDRLDVELPHYLPVVGYDMFAGVEPAPRDRTVASRLDLSALLSQVLLAFTLDFEREAELSLAMSANVLRVVGESGVRVVGERGVRVRDLSRLTGVSKEAVAVSVGFLERRGYVEVAPDPTAARTKVVRLKPKGRCALDDYRRRLSLVEERWQQRFGHDEIRKLRESLLRIASRRVGEQPIISAGLQPYPGGWRSRKPYLAQTSATLRDPGATLPHYPTVLHRGGWPDGS